MESLADTFVRTKPRETSGPRTSNRFDYQKDWALCKLLTLHTGHDDYFLILDYHEDIVVFNSENTPSSAHFYQVKTKKSGNWTVNALTKKDNDNNDSSILGKLFSNYMMTQEYTKSLVFVSNQGLSTKLKDGEKALDHKVVYFADLPDSDKEKIQKSLEGDNVDWCCSHGLLMLSTSKTELGINDHVAHTKGKLVEFFEETHPERNISTSLAYKTIFDEIKRKNNSELICNSLDDLRKYKGIGKIEFTNIINLIVNHTNARESWNEINQTLLHENYKLSEIIKIKKCWERYLIERMNASNEPLTKLKQSIQLSIHDFNKENPVYSLKKLVESIKDVINCEDIIRIESEPFIEAAIICEAITNDPIQETHKKLEEEKQ